ncbi:MAG: beta-ketoacyl-[acyl-carrier-protein] synthase family protein [Opitutales bacterium]
MPNPPVSSNEPKFGSERSLARNTTPGLRKKEGGGRRIFVTGLGFVTSIGNDSKAVMESLVSLRHGFSVNPDFDRPDIPVSVSGGIKDFGVDSIDPEDWTFPARYRIRREVLRSMPPHGLFAHCAMIQAIEDAGLAEADISNEECGLYTASGGSPYLLNRHMNRMYEKGVMRCSPMGIVSTVAGTLTFNLAAAFEIRGASCGFVSACASSGHALGFALDEIRLGRQKRMFVVGAEDGNRDSILPFAGMRALSLEKNPDKASRPFDAARSGFVGTGGAAVMVLESEEEVARRATSSYGEFLGWGQASDGHNVAISHPEGRGLVQSMERAMMDAGVEAGEVGYINAHAPSTLIGDLSEIRAFHTVFSKKGAFPAISSTKALTGHGLSLASVLEAGICCLAMKASLVPGSAHIESLDPACGELNILRETRRETPGLILSNSSGFGGANVSLVFGARK